MPPPSEEEGATRDTARITARLSLYKSGLGRHRSRRAHGEYCATIRTHFTRLRSGRLTGLMVVNFRDENFPLTPGGLKQEVTVHERLGSQRDGAPYWMKALMTLIIFFFSSANTLNTAEAFSAWYLGCLATMTSSLPCCAWLCVVSDQRHQAEAEASLSRWRWCLSRSFFCRNRMNIACFKQ